MKFNNKNVSFGNNVSIGKNVKIGDNTTTGYKVKYKNEEENLQVEFAIYNEKYRDIIIKDHTRKFVLPFYITCLLCLIKFFYYTLPILSKSFYIDTKKWILNSLYSPEINTQFIVLDEQ